MLVNGDVWSSWDGGSRQIDCQGGGDGSVADASYGRMLFPSLAGANRWSEEDLYRELETANGRNLSKDAPEEQDDEIVETAGTAPFSRSRH